MFFRRLTRRLERQKHGAVAATNEKKNAPAFLNITDGLAVVRHLFDGLAINLQNDVAAAEPGVVGGAAGLDAGNDDAFDALEAEAFGDLRRHLLHGETELALFRSGGDDLLLFHLTDRGAQRDLFLVAHNL